MLSTTQRCIVSVLVGCILSWFANPLHSQDANFSSFVKTYQGYLDRNYPATFTIVEVQAKKISLQGQLRDGDRFAPEQLAIAIIPPHVASQAVITEQLLASAPIKKLNRQFSVDIPRYPPNGIDRNACRFILVHRQNNGKLSRLSASTYPISYAAGVQRTLNKLVGKNQKGLGGVPNDCDRVDHQIYDLNLSHATVNIVLNGLIRWDAQPGFIESEFEKRSIFLNENLLEKLEARVRRLTENEIVVSAILLVGNRHPAGGIDPKGLVHPESNPAGKFSMPNLRTRDGAFLYRAVISVLAERFSREQPRSPRIANWILHNEIDQAGTWTTMGTQPIERYMETFIRSARIVHHATRKFDPHARVFVSLTHFWNRISSGNDVYKVRDLLELMAKACRVEGDFEWGVAYHPYPANLREPKTWDDQGTNFTFDTPLITPKNIEVLPAFLKQKRMLFQGNVRGILLSEQGINSRSLSIEDQKLQASGIVYTFNRIRLIPEIEAFHYHAYRDFPKAEGGLRLGLVTEKQEPKYAWEVYRSFGTASEQEKSKFAWEIMGSAAKTQTEQVYPVQRPPLSGEPDETTPKSP